MDLLNRNTATVKNHTERIVQFGEGNFLRAFANWMIHKMNKNSSFDAGVVVVQPIDKGLIKTLNDQDGLYTLYLNGIRKAKAVSEYEIIDCIQRGINPYETPSSFFAISENPDLRFVISNTTEAGISYNANDKLDDAPQSSFPGKLTALLYKRFQTFGAASDKGMIIIPCELIDRNGDNLKKIILKYASQWDLGNEFIEWINEDNIFCNTLVDRIVPGFPRDKMNFITKELGYIDNLVVEAEQFHLWVIEGPEVVKEEIPAEACGLNIVFTNNMEPYRTRKVRILNGAHTVLVPVGYLYGIDKVRESLEHEVVGSFLKTAIFEEICPTLDLPEQELHQFANDVLERFRNPYLEHELMSISLNSISKFKTRVLPSVIEYIKRMNQLPSHLLFSLAALIVFYKGNRNDTKIVLNDDSKVLEFFKNSWSSNNVDKVAAKVLSNTSFWGTDLTKIDGFLEEITKHLRAITNHGLNTALQNFLKNSL